MRSRILKQQIVFEIIRLYRLSTKFNDTISENRSMTSQCLLVSNLEHFLRDKNRIVAGRTNIILQ